MPHDGIFRRSTRDVVSSRFQPHGLVDIAFVGDILLYECRGPFNKELVESLAVAQLEILQAANHQGPWVSICLMRNSAVGSPEAFARYSELMHAAKPAQFIPIATAFSVAPEVEGGRLMMPRYAAIYTDIGRPFRIFEQLDEATAWARALIAAANADQ
jgi:hypothetical protein